MPSILRTPLEITVNKLIIFSGISLKRVTTVGLSINVLSFTSISIILPAISIIS